MALRSRSFGDTIQMAGTEPLDQKTVWPQEEKKSVKRWNPIWQRVNWTGQNVELAEATETVTKRLTQQGSKFRGSVQVHGLLRVWGGWLVLPVICSERLVSLSWLWSGNARKTCSRSLQSNIR